MGIQRSKEDLKGIYREPKGNRKGEGNLEEIQREFKGSLARIQRGNLKRGGILKEI